MSDNDTTMDFAESFMNDANDAEPTNDERTDLEKAIDDAMGRQADFSPYEAAGVASNLAQRYVREQMLYNYCAKGYIAWHWGDRVLKNGTTKTIKVIDAADLKKWLTKFFGPKESKNVWRSR